MSNNKLVLDKMNKIDTLYSDLTLLERDIIFSSIKDVVSNSTLDRVSDAIEILDTCIDVLRRIQTLLNSTSK